MLDIRYVRENQGAVAQAMANRNFLWDAAKFSELDEKRRAAIAEEESLQAQRNKASKEIGVLMGKGETRGRRGGQGAGAPDQREARSGKRRARGR